MSEDFDKLLEGSSLSSEQAVAIRALELVDRKLTPEYVEERYRSFAASLLDDTEKEE